MHLLKSIVFFSLLLLFSCTSKQWTITHSNSTYIALDSSVQYLADTAYIRFLEPYKSLLDAKMNEVIGKAEHEMRGHAPESLLSNFSADLYRNTASDYLKSTVDMAIVNLGGLRSHIPAGDITVRKIFELMPFENELVIVYLSGDKVYELCQGFAQVGGQGVSGITMQFKNKSAIDIKINNKALDRTKVYSIATNDFLAAGNDKMEELAQYSKRINTDIKIRDMLLNFVKSETSKGNLIKSALDGRVKMSEL